MNVIVFAERTWQVRGRGVSVPVCVRVVSVSYGFIVSVFRTDSLCLCFISTSLSLLRGRGGFVGEESVYLCVCA